MNTIKEILHKKREATEKHIKQLQREGKQGIRYTAMIPDIPFLILGLLSDIGWAIHLIAGIIYFYRNGFHHMLDAQNRNFKWACQRPSVNLKGKIFMIQAVK